MKDEFESGERVEVRDDDGQQWVPATFVQKVVDVSYWTQGPGEPACGWRQIRKIQPEHDLMEIEQPESIEQRLDKFEAILNNAIAHFNEQIASIKKSLK